MNPFASAVPQPLRVALIDAVRHDDATAVSLTCPDTGVHAVEMLARALARRGHAVDIYRARKEGEPVWEDLQAGVRIHRIAQTSPWPSDDDDQMQLSAAAQDFVAAMRHMARDIYPCDVVHAFGPHAGLVALRLTRGVPVPFVLSLQTQADDAKPDTDAVEDLLVRRADALIAFNERNRETLCQWYAAPRSAVHLVPRGVDTQCFRPGSKALLRRLLGWPEDEFIVLWGGSPTADALRLKEGLPLFRAASRVSAHVAVLGADSPWPAETAGIPAVSVVDLDEVARADRQAHLAACYAACDVLVVPAWHREGEVVNTREAMACGTPVLVLTDRGNDEAARAVEDGVTGYVLHRARPESLLQRLRLLIDQPQRRAAMGMAAVLRARTFYTWQKSAERFANVYANTHPADRVRRQEGRALTLIRPCKPRLVSTTGPMLPIGA